MSIESRTPPTPGANRRKRSPWLSRKFWLSLISFAVLLINQIWGIELDPAALAAVVLPIVAYILGEAWVDTKYGKNEKDS